MALSLLSDKNLLLSSVVLCVCINFYCLKTTKTRFCFLCSLLLHIVFNSSFINSTINSNNPFSSIVKMVNKFNLPVFHQSNRSGKNKTGLLFHSYEQYT